MERVAIKAQVFRAETLEQFMGSGIAVAKIGDLREYLETNSGLPLTDERHLMQTYMPPLCEKEMETLKAELKDQLIGVYHDGTTRAGEAFAICFRFCDANMQIKLRVVRVHFLKSTLNANEIGGELITTIAGMGVPLVDVLAFMNDAASVNSKAFRVCLTAACRAATINMCMGHTLNHVGEAMLTPYIDEFKTLYTCATSTSANARIMFKSVTGLKCQREGETRWNGSQDVVEKSLYPAHAANKLQKWAQEMLAKKVAPCVQINQ